MENRSTSVALVAEKARKTGRSSYTQRLQTLDSFTDRHCFDFHGNIAWFSGFLHLRLMLQAEVKCNKPGRRISDESDFLQLRV